MLTIRPEQRAAIGAPARAKFEQDMVLHLRSSFPEELSALSEDELETKVHEGLDRALERGLNTKQDLCRFLNLDALLGRAWLLEAWEQTPKGTPSAKLARLQKRASFELEAKETP